jgi:tRNA 2-thiouridine synthesizing protein E
MFMHRYATQSPDTETSSSDADERLLELSGDSWNRDKSQERAQLEGVELKDEHWDVVVFLRQYYASHGLPGAARTIAKALNKHFSSQGGARYLHRLFAGGPVTQGSRFANLRTPAYATDPSFGTSY